jgi:hypothetical protein
MSRGAMRSGSPGSGWHPLFGAGFSSQIEHFDRLVVELARFVAGPGNFSMAYEEADKSGDRRGKTAIRG